MRIWLDDLREPPDEGWVWVKTIEEATNLLANGQVESLSLDNDLGEGFPEGRRLALWMAEHETWPKTEFRFTAPTP
jgi:hypothetical protein